MKVPFAAALTEPRQNRSPQSQDRGAPVWARIRAVGGGVLVAALALLSLPALATDTVRGTLSRRGPSGSVQLLRAVQIDVWACPPGIFGICLWRNVGRTMTDESGAFSFGGTSITAANTTWGVRVLSMNDAAQIEDGRWYDLPAPQVFGVPLAPQDRIIDFTHEIVDPEWVARFRILSDIRAPYLRVALARDPRETDTLPRVIVRIGSVDGYDPVAQRLDVTLGSFGLVPFSYGLFVQHQLGSLAVGPMGLPDLCGQDAAGTPERAWRNGFAFALAVAAFHDPDGNSSQPIPPPSTLDFNTQCNSSPVSGRSRPLSVGAIINDLRDPAGSPDGGSDELEGYFSTVVQIMDSELDHLGREPTIDDFYRAAVWRGVPRAKLNSIFRLNQVEPPALIPGYDEDRRADYAVFRPSNGTWYFINSSSGAMVSVQFGQPGDVPVPGDYDGDQVTDLAVWRPSNGNWYVRPSGGAVPMIVTQWGVSTDIPVPGDYDGDGKFDRAIWRPSDGRWWVIRSQSGNVASQQWGEPSDRPIPGDYDGDLRTDYAVWRPSTATWYVILTSGGWFATPFGVAGAGGLPIPGDYDGDRRTDFGYFHAFNRAWWMQDRSLGAADLFGTLSGAGDVLAPADFDGDGRDDVAYWRPSNGVWTVEGGLWNRWPTPRTQQWGQAGDIPVARR